MTAVNRCAWTKVILSLYFIAVSGCPSNTNVFTTTGSSATLQYDANRLPDKVSAYRLKDPQGSVQAQFIPSTNTIQTLNLTFTGDTSTGNLSFRIDNVQTRDSGVYDMVKNTDTDTPLLCNTVYITGSLSVPNLTSNKAPSVGESVRLTCSSSSTTVPAGLSLVYTWQVDGVSNPADYRYTYSTSRRTLILSGVEKSDADKVFTCRAQEEGSRITSSSSSQLRMNVQYGPENVRLEPSASTYTRTEHTTLASITCRADCNPSCTVYTWTHLNSTWSIRTAVLHLGQVSRNEAGVYRCTVTRSAGYTSSIDVTVILQYPPSSATLTGNTSILANGINTVTLNCTSYTANPPATISWSRNGRLIDNTNPVQETAGDYGGKITSQVLELIPTRDDDGDVYICTASNTVNVKSPVVSQQQVLDLKYHPIVTSITGPASPVIEGQTTNNVFRCYVSSSPTATVTWFHDNTKVHESTSPVIGTVYSYTIPVINRTHAGLYRCVANNNITPTGQRNSSVTVYFAPLSVTLAGNTSILANDISKAALNCTSYTANPPATISWSRNGRPILNTNPAQETAGDYGGEMTSQVLELTPTRDDDGDVYRCTASNTVTMQSPVTSQHKILDLVYIPEIAIAKTPLDVTECTDRITLTCTVSSKPVSTITWYREQLSLSTTGGNNVGQYSITNIDRAMSGQYKCVANNGYGGNVQETVILTVKFTPGVYVTTQNVTVHNQSVDIICTPSGVPDQYTFSPWTHQWDINGPLLNQPGLGNSSVLRLTSLTYEHSGVYTCTVSNGVDCNKNPDAGTGQVYLVVKAAPVLIFPQPNMYNERISVASKINNLALFNFSFWSNADNTAVTCYKNIDGTRLNPQVGNIVLTQTTVRLPVFSSSIATTGTLASLSLEIQHVDDFGYYDIILSNQMGTGKSLVINVVAQGPPQVPVLESVSVLSPTEVSVDWTRGFHGGLDQTIVIQISTDEVRWENKTEVVDGMSNVPESSSTRLQGLRPSSLYYIRLLAYNDEGISDNYTHVLSFTTHSDTSDGARSKINVAAVAGSTIGVIVSLTMVGIGILLYRKFQCTCEMKIGRKTVDDMVMSDSPNVYEEMNRTVVPNHIYAELPPPVQGCDLTTDDGTNVYERTVTTTNPEHIYTDLQSTGKDQEYNTYVNIFRMT